MATLIKLKDKIQELVDAVPAVKKLVFDDLSTINSDSTNVFPLMLLKPPVGDYQDSTMTYKIFDMECFMFVPQLQDDENHWTENWDTLEDLAVKVLRGLFSSQPDFVLVGKVKFTPGHFEHNGMLNAVKATFQLRVYNACS